MMNLFQSFQDALVKMYPSLSVFSDIDWNDLTQEYIASHDERPQDVEEFLFNFPHYLQDKAAAGDCPVYLFELAYYEYLQKQIIDNEIDLPEVEGLHLNPSLSFLNLEYDINLMLDEATKGNVQIILRPHILCLYRLPSKGFHHIDITTPVLKVLEKLENGPLSSMSELPKEEHSTVNHLIELGVILKI
jgi:hypothetical protein